MDYLVYDQVVLIVPQFDLIIETKRRWTWSVYGLMTPQERQGIYEEKGKVNESKIKTEKRKECNNRKYGKEEKRRLNQKSRN